MERKVILTSDMRMDEFVWWSKLPTDLWYEIISRLPKNKLLELRCVSKFVCSFITEAFIPKLTSSAPISGFIFHWYTIHVPLEFLLCNGPNDLEDHIRYSPLPPSSPEDFVTEYFHDYVAYRRGRNGCFDSEFIRSYVSLLPFKMDNVADSIDGFLGCFNGFILVANRSSSPLYDSYYLCNPATKQCIAIPVNSKHLEKLKSENNDMHPFVGLAFDPLDHLPPHFKIIRCSSTHFEELDIFYSDTGKWVTHAIHLDDEIQRFELVRRSVYLNGVFYMLSMAKYLLCFDLREPYNTNAKFKARAVKLPQRSTRDDYFGLFEASDRCLYYATEDQYELLVWTFQVNNKASPWLFKYRFNIYDLRKLKYGSTLIFNHYMVYAVDLTEEVIFFGYDEYAWSYDIKSNRLYFLCNLDCGTIFRAENGFYPYSCCLVKLEDKMFTEPQPPSVL